MQSPRIESSCSSRWRGPLPTNPPSAAVSTMPSNDVVMPQKGTSPSDAACARSMYGFSDSVAPDGPGDLDWARRSFMIWRSQYCSGAPEKSLTLRVMSNEEGPIVISTGAWCCCILTFSLPVSDLLTTTAPGPQLELLDVNFALALVFPFLKRAKLPFPFPPGK